MESTLSNALILMVIGMISVFIVLLVVVMGGSILINFINKYYPESVISQVSNSKDSLVSPKIMAVLTAAVLQATGGKGHIDEVLKK